MDLTNDLIAIFIDERGKSFRSVLSVPDTLIIMKESKPWGLGLKKDHEHTP